MVDIAGAANLAVSALYNKAVEVKPRGLARYTCSVVFTKEYMEAEGVSGYAPTIQARKQDIDPSGLLDTAAQVIADGEAFRITSIEDFRDDYVIIRLERDAVL